MSEKTQIHRKMLGAVKWSFLGECAAKLVAPFTNMVLARILAPDDFGLLSIVIMITSFADLFTDAGFQKYLVQHYFESEKELYEYASVAFWTNMFITIIIWGIIVVTAVPMTILLKKPGYQWVIRIGSMKLFLTAFTSVQRAIYQRALDYKTLFYVRVVVAFVPVFITIPLALIGFDYWALVLGNLISEFLYAMILTFKSKWKPTHYFSIEKLKKMFSFSIWSLIEQFTIWLACYSDTLVLSVFLTDYMVGMYKQPETIVSSIFGVISASVFGILFSALSRMNDNNDDEGFWDIVLKVQLVIAIVVFPLGVGIYLYKELATMIILGAQWKSSIVVVGLMSVSTAFQVAMNNIASEIYRAKGEPKISVLAQSIYILCLIPVSVVGVMKSFEGFVYARASMSLIFCVIHYLIIKVRYCVKFKKIFDNIKYPMIATGIMCIVVECIKNIFESSVILKLLGIPVGILIYIIVIFSFRPVRMLLLGITNKMLLTKKSGKIGNDLLNR